MLNEEMYEEEDDDLPVQYRRLTAHLQTPSADFNAKLSSWLTTHVAARSGLAQAINASYSQQYPNAQQWLHQQPFYASPMLAHQQQQIMQQQAMLIPMQLTNGPLMNRQPPYPPPALQRGSQPSDHNRSASLARPQEVFGASQRTPVTTLSNEPQASMHVIPVNTEGKEESPDQSPIPPSAFTAPPHQQTPFPQDSFSQQTNPYSQFPLDTYSNMGSLNTGYSPFSMALPADSQMLLASTLPNDPYTSMMMAGSNNVPGLFYDFTSNPFSNLMEVGKGQQMYPSYDGLHSTLAPSALDLNQDGQDGQDYIQNQSFYNQPVNAGGTREATPAGTPGVGDVAWSSFMETDSWDMPLVPLGD